MSMMMTHSKPYNSYLRFDPLALMAIIGHDTKPMSNYWTEFRLKRLYETRWNFLF